MNSGVQFVNFSNEFEVKVILGIIMIIILYSCILSLAPLYAESYLKIDRVIEEIYTYLQIMKHSHESENKWKVLLTEKQMSQSL